MLRVMSGGLLESLPSLLMIGGQDMPDLFSTNLFASSFKVAAVCFRMIVLSTNFDTDSFSKDSRLIIITNLPFFSVYLDFKNLWQLLSF